MSVFSVDSLVFAQLILLGCGFGGNVRQASLTPPVFAPLPLVQVACFFIQRWNLKNGKMETFFRKRGFVIRLSSRFAFPKTTFYSPFLFPLVFFGGVQEYPRFIFFKKITRGGQTDVANGGFFVLE